MGRCRECLPPQSHTTQSLIPPEFACISITQAADSFTECELYRGGWQGVGRVELLHSPGWYHMEGSAKPKKDGVCNWGTQHRDLDGYLFSSLCRPDNLVSPHTTLFYSQPPSIGAQGKCLWMRFFAGLLRRHLTPIFPWWAESLLIFIARCYMVSSAKLWSSGLGSQGWVGTPHS